MKLYMIKLYYIKYTICVLDTCFFFRVNGVFTLSEYICLLFFFSLNHTCAWMRIVVDIERKIGKLLIITLAAHLFNHPSHIKTNSHNYWAIYNIIYIYV